MAFVWFMVSLCAMLAAIVAMAGAVLSKGAPQEAAAAGIALCIAVIPYVLARSFQLFGQAGRERDRHKELLAALEALRSSQAATPASSTPALPSEETRRSIQFRD